MSFAAQRLCFLLALWAVSGCGPSGATPVLRPVDDQLVAVNEELVLVLTAADGDGDELHYSFESDVPDIHERAMLARLPVGAGEFRWTPRASDVGVWFFDFTASDGGASDTITIRIEVRSAVGANSAPRFLHPQGTGTTLDLDLHACLQLDVEVLDADSTSVEIFQEAPRIAGAQLDVSGPLTAMWSWCPTDEQIAEEDRYNLVLAAVDSDNPKTVHPYLLVLRKALKPDCPGDAPTITHTAQDESTIVNLTLDAVIADDLGLKREPLLYYSTSMPSNPPDLGQMVQVGMLLIEGNMQSGTWAADVPNPVAQMPAGSTEHLYYVIVADDNDDESGDCDHRTQSPVYDMMVTNPGGAGGAGLCQSCSTDLQCGGTSDLCVRVGTAQASFCLRDCDSAADCPTDYQCSATPVQSVDGATRRQCVPLSNDCSNPGGIQCDDDALEDNDNRDQAQLNPLLDSGSHDLVSCPAFSASGDDEDWFEIFLAVEGQLSATLSGGAASDLDLAIYSDTGQQLESSISLDSTEELDLCLPQGFYTLRVYAYGPSENPYTLSYTSSPMSCSPVCADDGNENDDSAVQARAVSLASGAFTAVEQTICSGDHDWYEIELANSETVVVDLTFDQGNSGEDLDLFVYSASSVNLTPCCNTSNGQSGTSDEHMTFTAPSSGCATGCTYYVVVQGYNGAANDYDISIDLQ